MDTTADRILNATIKILDKENISGKILQK